MWSPVYGKLRLGGTIVHFDLHADVGVGVIDSKTSRGASRRRRVRHATIHGAGVRDPHRRAQPHVPPGAPRRAIPRQRHAPSPRACRCSCPSTTERNDVRREAHHDDRDASCAARPCDRRGATPKAQAEGPDHEADRSPSRRRRPRPPSPTRGARRQRRRHRPSPMPRTATARRRPPAAGGRRPRRAADDVDALRQEYLIAARRAVQVARARECGREPAVLDARHDQASTWTTGALLRRHRRRRSASTARTSTRTRPARSPATTACGSTATSRPARHLVTFHVEATGKDDDTFTSSTESQIVVKAVANKDLVVAREGARTAATSRTSGRAASTAATASGIDVAVKTVPHVEADGAKK